MSAVFADSAYYLALLNENDELHERAKSATEQMRGPIVTTAWVLAELADAMCRPRNRGLAVEFIRDLLSDSRVKVVAASQDLFDRGLELYSTRHDKIWSLTDCISFVVMQDHGLTVALTADRDFEQAGFTASI